MDGVPVPHGFGECLGRVLQVWCEVIDQVDGLSIPIERCLDPQGPRLHVLPQGVCHFACIQAGRDDHCRGCNGGEHLFGQLRTHH